MGAGEEGRAILPTRPVDTLYRESGSWEGRDIASFLAEQVRLRPQALAVVDGTVRLTFEELSRRATSLAAELKNLGVAPGRSVFVQLPNWWETLVAFHAVARLGAVINPVIPIYREAEISFIAGQTRPAAIIIPHRFRGVDYVRMISRVLTEARLDTPVLVVRPDGDEDHGGISFGELLDRPRPDDTAPSQPAPSSDDIALLLYTSGTTALPKGVLHSHDTLVYECRSIASVCNLRDDMPVFMPSPLTHITGFLYGFLMPAMIGCSAALLDRWDPQQAVDVVEDVGCRFTAAATPFLKNLTEIYQQQGRRSALSYFACGGADVPPDLVRHAARVLGCYVSRVYGSSEFPTLTFGPLEATEHQRAETDGYPVGEVRYRLDEVTDGIGELLVQGPEMFHGYLDASLNDDAFTEDGFFRTGDLASVEESGFIRIRGRKKDIIIRKGENISAREVEDHLYALESVRDVAVIAMPDAERGERVCAVVVTDVRGLLLDDLTQHLSQRGLAKQKWPEQLELVTELPRTASGKVQKFVLRAMLAGGPAS
jgi:cyclohexanecarboxylate-CoA ligase